MKIEDLLCKEMYKFVKEHIDEVENKKDMFGNNQTYEQLGFKNRKDMLMQIKNNPEVAIWALEELLSHFMLGANYTKELYVEEECECDVIYRIGDRFFRGNAYPPYIKEVKKVSKTIVVNDWEEVL